MTKKNILTVEVDAETYQDVAPPLLRKLFEVDRIPSAEGALELISVVPFSALILRFPLQGMNTDDFLKAVRKPDSASRESAVIVLTEKKDDAAAKAYLSKGVQLHVALEEPGAIREQRVCGLLGISPRRDTRILVKLMVALENSKQDRFIAQTKDVSVSGMFVITRKRHPVGSTASFEFTPPDDPHPIKGVAEVTRHSDDDASKSGMGFRFSSFEEDSEDRLNQLVEAGLV